MESFWPTMISRQFAAALQMLRIAIEACPEETFATLTEERALERCGFWWYELNVGEFHLNNLRHTQHHAGQLALLLRRRADISVDWLGTEDNKPGRPTW